MTSGLMDGDEAVVMVLVNGVNLGEITHRAVSNNELEARIYSEDERTLFLLFEVVQCTYQAIKFHMERPALRKLLEERIQQLKDEADDSEAGEPPYPTVH